MLTRKELLEIGFTTDDKVTYDYAGVYRAVDVDGHWHWMRNNATITEAPQDANEVRLMLGLDAELENPPSLTDISDTALPTTPDNEQFPEPNGPAVEPIGE